MKCIVLQTSVGHTTGFILCDRDFTHTAGRCVYLAAPVKIDGWAARIHDLSVMSDLAIRAGQAEECSPSRMIAS